MVYCVYHPPSKNKAMAMLDWFLLDIPFKSEFVVMSDDYKSGVLSLSQHDLGLVLVGEIQPDAHSSLFHQSIPPVISRLAALSADHGFLQEAQAIASFLSARDTLFKGTINRLSHPWEKIGSNYGSVVFKVFNDGSGFPSVQLKGSPAKLLQGHNVFGSDNSELCIREMLLTLLFTNPQLCNYLDFPATEVRQFDVTYSASVPQHLQPSIMEFLRNVSGGQTRSANNNYDSTCYWGAARSRHGRRKAYLKGPEVRNEIKKLRSDKSENAAFRLSVMNDPALLDFADSLVRFEARVRDRVMHRLGIPLRASSFMKFAREMGHSEFCQFVWKDRFKDIFASIEGHTMNVDNDDDVKQNLRFLFGKLNSRGKMSYTAADAAFTTYRNFRRYGWFQIREEMSKSSFHRHVSMITECGISKAFLQNLHGEQSANVVPLVRLINVDFSSQVPSWYVEPVSSFAHSNSGSLKLVR